MSIQQTCPLCGCITAECVEIKRGEYRRYLCSNCAEFVISFDAEASMSKWTRTTKDRLISEAKATHEQKYIYVITAVPQATPGPWLQGAPQLRSEVLGR